MVRKYLTSNRYTIVLLLVIAFLGGKSQDNLSLAYQQAIENGDTYFKNGDYISAKTSYRYASRIEPEETYPQKMINESLKKLRERMEVMDDYTKALEEAEQSVREKEFDIAIIQYQNAAKIIPSEPYPLEKIKDIEDAKDVERKRKIAFDDAIYRADKYVKYRKYEQALEHYEKANEIYPYEEYPIEKIEELSALIKEKEETKELYESVLANADRLFSLKYYSNALEEYQKAADARPDEPYPKQRISEVEKMLEEKEVYDQVIATADEFYMNQQLAEAKGKYQESLTIYPAESYPKDMIDKINEALKDKMGKDELYDMAIAAADEFFENGDITNALKEYENAADLKSREEYPQTKISEITKLIVAQKQEDQEYGMFVQLGDQYMTTERYEEAKVEYEKALDIKDDPYLQNQLLKIDNAISGQKAAQESYNLSLKIGNEMQEKGEFDDALEQYQNALLIKPGDQIASQKINEVKLLRDARAKQSEQYRELLVNADAFYNDKKYAEARNSYAQAINLDDTDNYPSERIATIDSVLGQRQEMANAYNKAIATGDIFFGKEEYEEARKYYEDALNIKPGAKYPNDKIGEIELVLFDAKQQGDAYQKVIDEADGLFAEQKYNEAKLIYMKAANMDPDDEYPTKQMNRIDELVKEKAANEQQYNQLMAAGGRMLDAGELEKAKEKFEAAAELMPMESLPAEKLNEISQLELNNELDVQQAYNDRISEADGFLASKDYPKAKQKYQQALKFKPGEKYPTDKIGEIERLVNDLQQLQANYNQIISDADRFYTSGEFAEAKAKYMEASALFPEEEHPKTRIEDINLKFKAQNQSQANDYDLHVAEGDKYLSTQDYELALISYQKAAVIKPTETYPIDMINQINAIKDDNAVRSLLMETTTIQNNEQVKYKFDPIAVSDRKASELVIIAKGIGSKSFKAFVNYGKGGAKNGGYILPVSPGEEPNEFNIPLGQQYQWFSADNNWITITPQGGSLEVSVVKIEKN